MTNSLHKTRLFFTYDCPILHTVALRSQLGGHKYKAFQGPLALSKYPPNDSYPVLQGHNKSLGTHHEAGSELCLKGRPDTPGNVSHQKESELEAIRTGHHHFTRYPCTCPA